jgi:hypothetical protein
MWDVLVGHEAEATGAEQDAFVPPLAPLHVQLHGPLPLTDDGVPALQRFADGLLEVATPLAEPHVPLTGLGLRGSPLTAVQPEPFHDHHPPLLFSWKTVPL